MLRYNKHMNRPEREIDFHALAAFRYEIRRYLNISEKAARAAGVEPQQHQALLAIKGRPAGRSATVGALAERLQIRHHSAVELSGRLAAKKLIRRERNAADRREVQLVLTPQGEKLLRTLSFALREELRVAGPKLIDALTQAICPGERRKTSKHHGAERKKQGKQTRRRRQLA